MIFRKLGLEWIWRIKEEPRLWKRYWHDGCVFLRLLLTRVVPIVIDARRLNGKCGAKELRVSRVENLQQVTIQLSGFAISQNVAQAISCFRNALKTNKGLVIDLSGTEVFDLRFLGLLLMLRKELRHREAAFQLIGVHSNLRRQFRLNGLEFLLE